MKNKFVSAIGFAIFAWIAVMGGSSHAANITVATGGDNTIVDGVCRLSEAIININAGNATAYPECTGVGAFGVNDTINLPSGTITLTADLPMVTNPIQIIGQGMSESVIDGNSEWSALYLGMGQSGSAVVRGLTVQAYAGMGIATDAGDIIFEEIEVDGTSAVSGAVSISFGMLLHEPSDYNVDIKNIYVHDVSSLAYFTNVTGMLLSLSDGANVVARVENVTVKNITAQNSNDTAQGIAVLNGPFSGGASGQLDLVIRNTTVDTVTSASGTATGIGVTTFNNDNATAEQTYVDIANVTLRDVSGGTLAAQSAGIGSAVAGAANGATVGALINVANALISTSAPSCGVSDITPLFGNTGVIVANNIVSKGGNFSADSSCAPYFAHATDHNNVSNLASTLGVLSGNGGFVPTIPLLADSPAIDGGVAVAGVSDDARGAVRPQGLAFDSGAYESSFSREATDEPVVPGQTDRESASVSGLADTGVSVATLLGLGVTVIGFGIVFSVLRHRLV
jgi:hypothetical protein